MHAYARGAGRLIVSVMAAALLSAGAAQAAKAPPKQLELYAMDCGKFPVPDADMFSDDGAYKGVSRTLIVPCYLVRHPKGDLVWDTGVPQSKQALLDQLKQLDLEPADIEYVSVSHGHFDHIGNAGLFASGTWIVDPDERAYVFNENARKNAQQFAGYSALETSKSISIDKPTHDVFGDGSVVIHQAPGHTPGHTILEVKLREAGTVLLTGDLWHLAESRANKRVPRFNVDKDATLKSYELTEALAAKTKARVVREHVMEDFEALPKFPAALK